MKRIWFLIFIYSLCWLNISGQNDQSKIAIEEYIEEVISSLEGDNTDNLEFIILLLEQLVRRPLNLNKDDLSPLLQANLVNDQQLIGLQTHIEKYGNLLSIYELQTIPNWDLPTIRRILPIIQINRNLDDLNLRINEVFRQSTMEMQSFYSTNFPKGREFETLNDTTPARYEGSIYRHYLRFRAQYQYRLSIGLTAEKDAGEAFFSKSNSSYDHLSFHAYGQAINKYIRVLALGDYKVNFGQGLIIHNGFGGNKSAFVTQIKKGGRVLRPHTSTSEINYFRGAGIEFNIGKNWYLTTFYSRIKRDANIVTDTAQDEEFTEFTSLQTSGLHRTDSEIKDEKKINHTAIGGRIGYEKRNIHIYLNGLRNEFDGEFSRNIQPYNQFRFQGNKLFNASIDYSFTVGSWHIFGESASDNERAMAHLIGVKTSLSKKVNWVSSYRNYPRDYVSIQPSSFGESREANNEEGFYTGLEYYINQKFQLHGYADFWSNPWLRFNVDALSRGQEYLFKFRYYEKRKLEAYVQFRHEKKAVGFNDETAFSSIENRKRNQLRCHFIYKISKSLEWRSRVEFTHVQFSNHSSEGYMIYQDFIFKSLGFPLSFTTRYAFYDTDDYESRIYAYENHLLNNFRLSAISGTGHRYYINLRYRPIKPLTVEMRYEQTLFSRPPEDGFIITQSQTIEGNAIRGMAFQVRWVF